MLADRLRNWTRCNRWCQRQMRALSVEGLFRSPQRWHEVAYAGAPVDVLDAWTVELAWRRLPAVSHWVLKFHYHAPDMHPACACRLIARNGALALRVNDWSRYLRVARFELAQELGEAVEAPRPR